MSDLGPRIAMRARQLVGTPFRLHGRDAQTGLDCVGLGADCLKWALHGARVTAPQGYRLRNSDVGKYLAFARTAGLAGCSGKEMPGDILHVHPGPGQNPLLIVESDGTYIHAHAGLRRVVATPGPLCDPLLHHWRAK